MRLLTLFLTLFIFSSLQPDNWRRVYLATYPRSGNHWVRALIEEATRVSTGSVYCDFDPQHLKDPFPWGGYTTQAGYKGICRHPHDHEVVLIKTHFPAHNSSLFDKMPSIHTIRIVRNPADSIYSQYVYVHGNNLPTKHIPRDRLERNIAVFKAFQEHWDKQPNVTTFRYEDLFYKPYLFYALDKMLKILGVKVKRADILKAISKNPPIGRSLRHTRKFSRSDLELISERLSDFMEKYNYCELYDENT